MEELLTTKFYIPAARRKLVPRPRLIEQLNNCLHCKLTLLSAPAGFGKTTLLSEWVEQLRPQRVPAGQPEFSIAWLSLDLGDNDPARFLAYLIAALNQGAGLGTDLGAVALSLLQSPQTPVVDAALTSLINELAALPDPIALVLDDYHLVDAEPIHQALTFLLEHLPPNLHLVIATREDPDLPLARLRARSELNELRAADLRFTSTEAAEFLNRAMGLDLSAQDIRALETRTEGWIAGLQLAALSLRGSQNPADFIQSFTGSHRYVLDYLIEEVLEQQPAHVQTFLQQTAILDRLSGDLCDALTGEINQQANLDYLEQANLFIVPLDDERRWYRYHHLFSDALRQRIRPQQTQRVTELHLRAAAWFRRQGLSQESIKHSLAAQDYEGAADLIQEIAMDVIQAGKHTAVVGWINALPDELVKERPYLCVLHAWALHLTGEMELAQDRLAEAESSLNKLEDQDDIEVETILGLIHSQRAYKAFMTGKLDKTIYHAQQALDHLPENAALEKTRTSTYQTAAHLFLGQLQAAMEVYNEILPTIPQIVGTSTATMCLSGMGDLHVDMAQLHRARDIYQQALDDTKRHNGRPDVPFTGLIFVRIGQILRQWNQLDEALRYTSKGLALCRNWNIPDVVALSCIEMAYIQIALGLEAKSKDAINEAVQIMASFSPFGTQHAAGHQAKIHLACGDVSAAERWAQTSDIVLDGDFKPQREIEYLSLTRLFIAQKRFEEACSLAHRIYQIAQKIGKKQTELEALILLALASCGQGETDYALVHLEQALQIGEPEDYVRIFVGEGPPMAQLLYKALARGMAPEYVQRLLAAFPDVEAEPVAAAPPKASTAEWIEPLSARENEVLQLIAEGLTNQEIAARLYLSKNTVKVHARNIYGKLGVHNRSQASTRARALGFLAPIRD